MKKKSTFLKMAAAAAMSGVMLLTGCSGGGSSSKNSNELVNGVPKDPYEIQWYFTGNPNQTDIASVEAALNEYLKEKINATVKMNSLDYATYENKINMMLAGNEALDLMFTTTWCANYTLNVSKGAFRPLDELLDQYAPKTKELLGEEFLKGPRVDGQLYGIPANKDKGHNWGFVYRKDLADKYNIDMSQVHGFEDLIPILDIIKENEPDVTPLGMGGGRTTVNALDFNLINNLMGGFFPDSDSDTLVNLYETPEYKEALDLARRLYEGGYVRKDAAISQNYSSLQKEGAFFVSLEQCKPGKADELSASSNGYTFAQQDITPPRTTTDDTLGSMMAIPVNSKNPERVMMFIELINTDPYVNNLINYGIEDKHYTKVSDNIIEVNKDGGYTQAGSQWQFGNVFLNYILTNESPTKFEDLEAFNEQSEPLKTLGFSFDTEPVKNEVVACENVKKEFVLPLETGSVDPNEVLPQFLEKLKQAGSDKIMAEMQRQYDEWRATQN